MSWLHISTTEKPLKVKNWIQVKQNFFHCNTFMCIRINPLSDRLHL